MESTEEMNYLLGNRRPCTLKRMVSTLFCEDFEFLLWLSNLETPQITANSCQKIEELVF